MEQTVSEYERERREKLERLRQLGIDPFGQRTAGVQALASIKEQYKPEMGHDAGPVVKGAGRIMLKRDMGKLSFLTLRDDSGQDLQVALDKKRLDETAWKINELLDLGDQIVVEGSLGTTKKGEVTIWATALAMASKSLLPPPGKFHGLEDVEQRYRQRYVDLWANPEVMQLALLRIRMVDEMRSYLRGLGYVEVETPMMQILHGGAAARPFVTHHNALDIQLYMRIAPELFLKRLLVGGMRKVFEINRNFRNEGISPRHNPEFTMLEAYEAYGSWETMADMVEGLITHIAEKVFGTLQIEHKNAAGEVTRKISLTRPWRRVRVTELVEERTGCRFDHQTGGFTPADSDTLIQRLAARRIKEVQRRSAEHVAKIKGFDEEQTASLAQQFSMQPGALGKIVEDIGSHFRHLSAAERLQEVYEKLIEPELIDPTFVTHIPSVIIPLAKENREDPFFADVYELAINGVEISPGYTELNDPDVQAKHFAHQVGDKEEQHKVDEDFLNALKYGMPPAGGMGLGVDRLLMMLTGAESIRDVILFPLMKPQS